jgi:hypothetical protein
VLVILLQNADTDCKRMGRHFFPGERPDLATLGRAVAADLGAGWQVRLDTIPSWVTTRSFADAYHIAEFMLNLLPLPAGRRREPLAQYVQQHFAQPDGEYRFSCHQDVLQVGRGAAQGSLSS